MNRSRTHVIVVGNEKGGSGKSTTAFHLAVFLLYQGFRVASMDADSRQQTLTHYVRNRRSWARRQEITLPHPTHYHLPLLRGDSAKENSQTEFGLFREAMGEIEGKADFLVIDTPGFDTNLSRLSHSLADILITPLNDSLIDLDVLGRADAAAGRGWELSHYGRLVQRARSERMSIDGETIDWVLVRNRVSMLGSRNTRDVQARLEKISERLGCRIAEGIAERVIFRSLFPSGLTVFDPLDPSQLNGVPSVSHISAREEYKQLALSLNLPSRDKEDARFAALAAWSRPGEAAGYSGQQVRAELAN